MVPSRLPPHATRVFHGVLSDVWQWDQERFDGSHDTYECIIRQDTVTTIPFVDANTVLLTRQEQSGRPPFIDVPGGRVDEGETHEQAARRELQEETGYTASVCWPFQTAEHLGQSRFAQTVFVAAGLKIHEGGAHQDAGERIVCIPTPWDEVVRMALNHELRQAEVMLAILRLAYDPDAKRRLVELFRSAT